MVSTRVWCPYGWDRFHTQWWSLPASKRLLNYFTSKLPEIIFTRSAITRSNQQRCFFICSFSGLMMMMMKILLRGCNACCLCFGFQGLGESAEVCSLQRIHRAPANQSIGSMHYIHAMHVAYPGLVRGSGVTASFETRLSFQWAFFVFVWEINWVCSFSDTSYRSRVTSARRVSNLWSLSRPVTSRVCSARSFRIPPTLSCPSWTKTRPPLPLMSPRSWDGWVRYFQQQPLSFIEWLIFERFQQSKSCIYNNLLLALLKTKLKAGAELILDIVGYIGNSPGNATDECMTGITRGCKPCRLTHIFVYHSRFELLRPLTRGFR